MEVVALLAIAAQQNVGRPGRVEAPNSSNTKAQITPNEKTWACVFYIRF